MAAVDTSARTMLNDHGRALRQFLALVRRLDRRGPGLTLSSERGHQMCFTTVPFPGTANALKGEDHADASVSTQGAWLLAAPALLSTQ